MDQYSPKSSPRQPMGSRSPSVTAQQVDSSGLKMTISLKQKTPFYLLKMEQTPANETTGATNLMAARGLEHSYHKLTTKKMKDSLSSFLPHLPGIVDTPGDQDNSSLRGIIEKPPVCGKELAPLNQLQLSGFRLHPGPLPEQYRSQTTAHARRARHNKHKRHHKQSGNASGSAGGGNTPTNEGESSNSAGVVVNDQAVDGGGGNSSRGDEERERRRERKHKRHEKDADERKKRKKEKKRKKNREDKDV